jgi:putative tricarboxylic transport membrane protein
MSLSRDGITGLILLGISLVLIVQSLSLPSLPIVPVGPGFYPRIVLGFLALASLVLVVQDFAKQRSRQTDTAPAERRNYPLVVALFVIFGAYVGLMPLIGFRIATGLFVAAVQAALDPPRTARQWVILAAVSLGAVVATYLVFERYLLVLLPRGTWTGF